MKKILASIVLFFSPITFVFSQDKYISTQDRILFLGESIFKFAPLYYLYGLLVQWYGANETFATSLILVLVVNAIVGVRYHMKMRTLSIKDFCYSTFSMLSIIIGVYLILKAFGNVLGSNIIGDAYKSIIEFITLLYPGSKVLQNVFILTNGKYPPLFVMKALYAYSKDGKINRFIDMISGKLEEESISKEQLEKEQHGLSETLIKEHE